MMTNNEWTKTPPTEPGWYWVWQGEAAWPCGGDVNCVLVEKDRGVLLAYPPRLDFADRVAVEDDRETWSGAQWLGPISLPEPPRVEG